MDKVHGGKMFWRQLKFTVWVWANSYPGQLQFVNDESIQGGDFLIYCGYAEQNPTT